MKTKNIRIVQLLDLNIEYQKNNIFLVSKNIFLIFFAFCFFSFANAQIVNIPDANFKVKLLSANTTNNIAFNQINGGSSIVVDTNGNGEIEYSEALNVIRLDVLNTNITDLTGIEAFLNLGRLNCYHNQLTTLDVNTLTSLQYLDCNQNQLTNLNVSNLTSLIYLNCSYNQITSLNTFNSPNIQELNAQFNPLTSCIIAPNSQIRYFRLSDHFLSNLNLSNQIYLHTISLTSYSTTPLNLNISGCTSSNFIMLAFLPDYVSSINASGCTYLEQIQADNKELSSINVMGCNALGSLYLQNNYLTSIDVSSCSNLGSLSLDNNLLTSLDISNCKNLGTLDCNTNNLTFLNLKNGKIIEVGTTFDPFGLYVGFTNNPLLSFVCYDRAYGSINQYIIDNNYTNVVFNSYCTFTPGGTYNTITGTTHFDSNNNGCDSSDPIVQNQRIDITDGTNAGTTFTNNQGNYIFYVQQPNLALTPYLENPTYFTVTPPTANFNFPTNNNSTQTQDFCINANGIHNDLEIVIAPIGAARPGFDAQYQLVFKNKGNQTLSGTINLTFDDAKTDFVSALPTVVSQTVNNLSWNYTNLLPFESRVIDVVLNLNSPLETPAVNSGDVLNFTTTINPIVGDDLPLDNVFDYHQTVVNSFDPNIITCLEGDSLPPTAIGEYVHYTVQFENTGTASAVNVVVNDVIDATKYDISTLQVLNSSNNVRTDINNNTVEFIFQNINLVAVTGTPPVGGHGDVLFKIKTKSSLIAGDNVLNKAKIFFDYNAPIVTNDAITTFAVLNNSVFVSENSVSVSPNPATTKINIITNNTVKSIELYDIQGRILETVLNANLIDISDKSNGIYFLKITTDIGSKIEKVVKE